MSENYSRVSKLGSGAFATTFLVRHNRSGDELVLKRVPCRHMKAANAALQEVKTLLSLHHEGIVGYRDFYLDSDAVFVKPWCPRFSMSEHAIFTPDPEARGRVHWSSLRILS